MLNYNYLLIPGEIQKKLKYKSVMDRKTSEQDKDELQHQNYEKNHIWTIQNTQINWGN